MKQYGLILFDIDGTLTRTQNGFLPFNEAFLKTFGFAGDIRTVVPDGNTDPLIVEEIFAKAGRKLEAGEAWRQTFAVDLRDSYARAVEEGRTTVRALPGALELVRALGNIPGLYSGIVTGNFELTARWKLEAAGLGGYPPLGACGSDACDRADLPRIAKGRCEEMVGAPFGPERCVVVGDTPKDLEAARANRMKCVLVGTGRFSPAQLRLCGPDACLHDLADTDAATGALLALLQNPVG
ncbi:MAG: HAD family hydrolase [Deltaproteobacteria bacterium]|nr:HAD family hydrolase [Deltaproteobacteria bacterium]